MGYSPWDRKESDTTECLTLTAAKSLQLCPTLCDPIDGILRPWDSPGKSTGVGCHRLLLTLTTGVNERQRKLTCCSPWDCKESDMT